MSAVPRWVEAAPATSNQSGFTLLELVIVIILVMVLFLTAWWRLMPLRGDAEAAHVATTVGTLRSALGLAVTERIVKESLENAAELEASNPMKLLGQTPSNYIGEIEPDAHPAIEGGRWYFDPSERLLHYRVRFPQYLEDPSVEPPVDLSWRVQLNYRDSDGNGAFDASVDSLRGIGLEALDNLGWPDPEENIPEAVETP